MTPEREKFRDAFLAARLGANPGTEPPELTYENGWWCFRYRMTGMVPNRYRQAEVEQMLQRLLARAKS